MAWLANVSRPARDRLRWHQVRRPSVNRRKIEAYLRTTETPRLQLGSGATNLPGWLNADYEHVYADRIFLDATVRFPFADGTFASIFSEHMIEHVSLEHGRHMLRECHRVLRPGGRVRISTPNLARLAALCRGELTAEEASYLAAARSRYLGEAPDAGPAQLLNHYLRAWGHQFVYDPPALRAELAGVGFVGITQVEPGESADPALRGLEGHARQIGEEMNRFESMVFEAVRP